MSIWGENCFKGDRCNICTYFEPALLELSELTTDAARLMIFPALLRNCPMIWDAPLPLLRLGACGTVGPQRS